MNPTSVEELESQAFGLMGRLHVLLRREIGRVTDIKYMSTNPEYCLHVLELANSTSNTDLHTMCHKLEDIYFAEGGLFANSPFKPRRLMVASSSRVSIPIEHAVHEAVEPEADAVVEQDQHYVGRLR
ncbi:hypothetical protein GCM10011613_29610 [Cellvibrio zantedeschiae]|uniref:Uncharacterized protein n=1 Tax=Cellvibrio zantedeschiae TaxID=1237077 RepID=A0ABQ3BAF9_9GAMM|nr:hypothetical protein [Cellvibrio zantedeschiae]GGY82850.1 hypothetical protein GCM10011613_29610 [Cellvibrio zantedeschiae]